MSEVYQSIIHTIYAKYNPAKVEDVPELLKKYQGKEEQLLELICEKYNVSEAELSTMIAEFNAAFSQRKNKGKYILLAISGTIILILLAIFLTHSTENKEIEELTTKFIRYAKNKSLSSKLGTFELINSSYSSITNNSCESDLSIKATKDINDIEFYNIHLLYKKYETGWAIEKYAYTDKTDVEIQYKSFEKPLNLTEIDKLLEESNLVPISNQSNKKSINSPIDSSAQKAAIKKLVLDVLRKPIEKELKQEVKFIVYSMDECDNWILLGCKPVKQDGSPVDYSRTEYQRMIDEGAFDEGILALFHFKNGVWVMKEYTLGGTDTPIQEWIKKHNLENCSSEFGLTEKN